MNPQDTQQFEQNWLKAYQAGVQQPAAQLQETQAAADAAGASAALQTTEQQTAAIKAQQAEALQNLRTDLQKGTTLRDALSKYTSLGMSPDEIFKNYLSESPYGVPHENPNDLQQLGITAGALGKIGDPGSFMDKYNTKNAITELRNLESYYNQASPIAKNLPIIGAQLPESKAYEAAKTVFGNHLASLIPGASGAQATGQSLLGQLPDLGNPLEPYAASGQFNAIEKQLLASKGYSLKDIGLAPTIKPATKGSDLISTLLSNAGKDITGINQSLEGSPFTGFGIAALQPEKQQANVQQAVSLVPSTVKQYTDIATNPAKAFTEHPVSSTLAVLGPILGLKGGPEAVDATAADQAETASTAQTASDVFSKAPGKLQQFLNPTGAKNIIGQIRDQIITNADKTGATISGDQVAAAIRQWADTAKMSNLPDAAAIEDAAKTAEAQYAGKTFKPSDLKTIYDNIEGGYTKGGVPKSASASFIDRGVQDVLQQQLEKVAPGFQKTTDLFRQTFQAEKSPVKGIAKRAVGVGLGLGGLDFVRHILGL